ncbi:Uu.00g091280.m01.CDS01 [Anthostomella pinea]|uniref:Uu.00g091280.m01.CDS01 n=1 Tax=Anthostomella pinea TaxID=933095 RepID=A0AAI8VNP1_9PEZI|nr:Uu.00g091280.m01.CDS01 [Anthostomella pinea]
MQQYKSKSKPSRSWSEYKWSEQYKQWYSERVDRHGNLEYSWAGSAQPAQNDQTVPRSDLSINPIDHIIDGVANLGVSRATYSQGQSIDYQGQHASNDPATFNPATSPSYTHSGHSQSRKGKGKEVAASKQGNYTHGHHQDAPRQAMSSSAVPSSSYQAQPHTQYQTSSLGSSGGRGTAPSMSPSVNLGQQPNTYYSERNDYTAEDLAYEEAIRRSKEKYQGQSKSGESSNAANSTYGTGSTAWPTTVDPGTYAANPAVVADNDTTPRGTPVPSSAGPAPASYSNYIHGTPGTEELLDSRFRVEYSGRFQPGEVFKILWAEPLGQVGMDDPISDTKELKTQTGRFYVGFRRFIIVTTDESHHSTCVPILTYDRRGCGKRGVKANKHGIIYAAGSKPRLLRDEPSLGFSPVALSIYAEGEKLAKESRVNYSKLITIEHNVKVFFIGSIAQDHFENVRYAVNDCWDKKMHRSSTKKPKR